MIVSNRCYEHACELAGIAGGRALHLDAIPGELAHADIVIACTGAPHAVIHGHSCSQSLKSRCGRDIALIDIAVPRDIDPSFSDIPGVFLYDIDDLQNVIDRTYRQRLQAAHQARGIIEQESRLFIQKIAALPVVPVIFALKQQAEQIKQEELQQALAKLGHLSEHDRQAVATPHDMAEDERRDRLDRRGGQDGAEHLACGPAREEEGGGAGQGRRGRG